MDNSTSSSATSSLGSFSNSYQPATVNSSILPSETTMNKDKSIPTNTLLSCQQPSSNFRSSAFNKSSIASANTAFSDGLPNGKVGINAMTESQRGR